MICILDTSILCELLEVPGKCQNHEHVSEEFSRKGSQGFEFIIPLAAIIETGNHIGQANGERYSLAERFAKLVLSSLEGRSPFTIHPFPDFPSWQRLLEDFPEWAAGKSGLGDLTIVQVHQELCARFRARHVEIWSKDQHLAAYGG